MVYFDDNMSERDLRKCKNQQKMSGWFRTEAEIGIFKGIKDMFEGRFFSLKFVLCPNLSLYAISIANELSEFRNYLYTFSIPNHFYYTHNVKKSFKKRNPFFKKGTSFLQNA